MYFVAYNNLKIMSSKVRFIIAVVASCVLGALGAWLFLGQDSAEKDSIKSIRERRLAKVSRSGSIKRVTEISVNGQGDSKSVRIVESETTRPNVVKAVEESEGDEEEKVLSEVQKSVLKDIQVALDADDVKALRKALSRFTASVSKGGLGGYANVPKALRSAAVQALGWFGKSTATELVSFMADPDEDISSDAFDKFEFALQDVSMSDYERSAIVKATAKALTDPERIETLLGTLMDMRNSVKCDTVIAILEDGTSQARTAMLDEMDFYFEEGVNSVDGVKKWQAENPDDPFDEDFYGGDK